MKLYVDGKLVGQRADVTCGQDYTGYWRVGGDNLGGWPNQPASNYFAGAIDEVAIYPTVLTRQTDRRPVGGQRPHLDHPGGTGRRLRRGGLQRRPAAVLAARRDQRHHRRRLGPERRPDRHLPERRDPRRDRRHQGHDRTRRRPSTAATTSSPAPTRFTNPKNYSEEAWFKTTTTTAARSSASAAARPARPAATTGTST